MRAFIQVILIALLVIWSVGCEGEVFRADTRLMEDGSLERIVYQPLERTPKAVRKDSAWKKAHQARKMENPDQASLSLPDLLKALHADVPPTEPLPAKIYWTADGKFANVETLPDHFVYEAPAGLPPGRLVRKLLRRDDGLVTRLVWRETLTDIVTLPDQSLARNEAAELAVGLLMTACSETWGPEYDLKEFEHWIRQDWVTCFQELCDAHLESGLKKSAQPIEQAEFLIVGAKLLERRGLVFMTDEKVPFKTEEEFKRKIEAFITEKLQHHVRDKQGQPLAPELLQDVLQTLFSPAPEGASDGKPQPEPRLKQSFNRAVLAKFGTQEKFQQHVDVLGTRIMGLYGWPLLQAARVFDYRLDVPGLVMETNGKLVGERTLRWKFQGTDAFPLGYEMRAVIVVPNIPACSKYFPRAKFDRREVIAEYMELVDADPTLRSALNELVLKDDPTAWKIWQVDHLNSTRLLELLQPKASAGAK